MADVTHWRVRRNARNEPLSHLARRRGPPLAASAACRAAAAFRFALHRCLPLPLPQCGVARPPVVLPAASSVVFDCEAGATLCNIAIKKRFGQKKVGIDTTFFYSINVDR